MSAPVKLRVRVHFRDVGRDKKSWSVDASDVPADDRESDGGPSANWLAGEAKRGAQLMSQDVYVNGADVADLGVFAGMRRVGSCSIEFLPDPDRHPELEL